MTQQRAIRTRASLITSAAYEFAEHGYASASVNTILDIAGCTKGAMYFHFKSKAELADAVLGEARAIYGRIVEPWLAHPTTGIDLDPIEAVRAMAMAVADAAHTHTELGVNVSEINMFRSGTWTGSTVLRRTGLREPRDRC